MLQLIPKSASTLSAETHPTTRSKVLQSNQSSNWSTVSENRPLRIFRSSFLSSFLNCHVGGIAHSIFRHTRKAYFGQPLPAVPRQDVQQTSIRRNKHDQRERRFDVTCVVVHVTCLFLPTLMRLNLLNAKTQVHSCLAKDLDAVE